MIRNSIEVIRLQADDGMVLTNGETYSTLVYLGVNDDPNNWTEIPESEMPKEELGNDILNPEVVPDD